MSSDQIIVRPFRADEWQVYKAVRLQALQDTPGFFGSSYAREINFTDKEWQNRACSPHVVTFGLFAGDDVIGLCGTWVEPEEDPTVAHLWGHWIVEEWRGKGLSAKIYKTSIDWAKQRPELKRLLVSHRKSNVSSFRSHQKHGFTFSHERDFDWPDGTSETLSYYELRL